MSEFENLDEYGGQVQLRNDIVCPVCLRRDGLFIHYGDGFMCVDCVAKENGEDGEP